MPEPEPEYMLLDVESVQDPELLVEFLSDMLDQQRVLDRALALVALLLLHHLGEVHDPPAGIREASIESLRAFLDSVAETARHEEVGDVIAEAMSFLVRAKE